MTNPELVRLLRAVHELDVQDLERELAEKRKGCLSYPRARQVVLNPFLRTADEKAHVAGCASCARLLQNMERGLNHPTLWMLLRGLAGLLDGEEKAALTRHLETDECQRCLRLNRSVWLRQLADVLRVGQKTAEQVQEALNGSFSGFALIPVGGRFAGETELPFSLRTSDPSGRLTVTLFQASKELRVCVETPDASLAGRRVFVEVPAADGPPMTAEVLLRPHEHGCDGQAVFGELQELLPRLGGLCAFTATLDGVPQALQEGLGRAR